MSLFVNCSSTISQAQWHTLVQEQQNVIKQPTNKAERIAKQETDKPTAIVIHDPVQIQIDAISTLQGENVCIVNDKFEKKILESLLLLAQSEREIKYNIGNGATLLSPMPAASMDLNEGKEITLTVYIMSVCRKTFIINVDFAAEKPSSILINKSVKFDPCIKQSIYDIFTSECPAKIRFSILEEPATIKFSNLIASQKTKELKSTLYAVEDVIDIFKDYNALEIGQGLFDKDVK
jgi:hypothetical protein